jgi:hypothetical protein
MKTNIIGISLLSKKIIVSDSPDRLTNNYLVLLTNNNFCMKVERQILFLFILTILFFSSALKSQDTIPSDFCISEEEFKLYTLINDYRVSLTLSPVPLSRSLSFVARQHAIDLSTHNPDTNTCNFHSWSDKGNWAPCCFEKEVKDKSCMINKPGEITSYPGYAYETVYWENKAANAEKAFNQWKETIAARALMTNFKEWENYHWNALGVAIYKGFAIAWFGEETDPETKTRICDGDRIIENKTPANREEQLIVSTESGRYYVIAGSFNSLNDAKNQLNKYIQQGFKKAKVVIKDNKFRISLSDYPSMEQANKAKSELPAKYKDAWVLAF